MASPNFLDQIKDLTQNLVSSSKEAMQWYKEKVGGLGRNQEKLFKKASMPNIGSMYLFAYDPKYKDTLPFYDMFPLVLPLDFSHDGFLGLNLHYLPPLARSALLARLMDITNNDKYDEKTKLNLSYEIVKKSAKNTNYKVCIKRYLYGHVKSSFYEISPTDWKKVVIMPLQKWQINPNKKYAGAPPY